MNALLQQLDRRISEAQRLVDRQAGEARLIATQGQETKEEVTRLKQLKEDCSEAITVLQSFGEARQQDLQTRIETLVTAGLRAVFDESMVFAITQKKVGSQMAMDFTIKSFVNGELVETSIMDARGGGVAATAGFLLRLIVILLQKDKVRPTLVLDESFAMVSSQYSERLSAFLRELVDKTEVQIILVTHSDLYEEHADITYRFSLVEGVTEIERS